MSSRTTLIIVAAGTGSRFGATLPKQFCLMNGRPVVMHTIDALRSALPDARLILVISAAMVPLWQELCDTHGFDSPEICHGGETRWHSVRNAIDMIVKSSDVECGDIIGVHDGARPLVDAATASRAAEAVNGGADGAIPVISVSDSLRRVDPDGSSHSVDRTLFRAVQTPQMFNAAKLSGAYDLPWQPSFTDDASVMEAAGHTYLQLTPGSPVNIKITNPDDLAIAELLDSLRRR